MNEQTGAERWRFQTIKSNILRCTYGGAMANNRYSLVLDEALAAKSEGDGASDIKCEQKEHAITVRFLNGAELAIVDFELRPIDVIRYTTGGEAPVVETIKTVDGQRTQIANLRPVVDRTAFEGRIDFSIPKSARIFGLGQDEEGRLNKRGIKQYLYQHNMRTPMPFFVTDLGYGVFFDCASLMVFDDTGETTRVLLDTVEQIDCYLIAGTMDEIVSGVRCLTGTAALLPRWSFGYLQSRERYATQQEVLDVARRYRELHIPLDCVVQDWKTWEGDLWGQKTVDRVRYPDLAGMNQALHEMHVHSMVSVWPNMAPGGANHAEFAKAGLLLGDDSTYDAFSAEARDLYWKQLERELVPGGFDAWWCDSTEPFTAPDWCGEQLLPEEERYRLVGGEHKKYLDPEAANLFSLEHAKGIFEHERTARPGTRVMNLTRSGYSGIQRYGVALWAGDTSARWDVLRREIAKGINLCLSGIPFWTVDIGAFFAGATACWRKWSNNPAAKPVWFWDGDYDDGINDPAYRELYVRWLQFGAFLPLFRSHGTDTPREIWNFGAPGEPYFDAIAKFIRLRYTLMPTIYSLAMRVALEDYTMLRGLLFDFPQDQKALDVDDEFLLGDSLLICPVTRPMRAEGGSSQGRDSRVCYLPEGCNWYSYWTNAPFTGGQQVSVAVALDSIPVFVRAGSILFTQRPTESTEEDVGELEVRIYPGADASAVYYTDDGVSYAYLDGRYDEIRFFWNDEARQLRIRAERRDREDRIPLVIHFSHTETSIRFRGGEQVISFA